MFSVAVLFLRGHGSVGFTVCESFHVRSSYVVCHNSCSHFGSVGFIVCEWFLPNMGVTVLTGLITLWSCWLNRGWVIVYNSVKPYHIVLPSTLALLAEKDVRDFMSLSPVTSHSSFSYCDIIALSACKSFNVRSGSHVFSYGFSLHCDLIALTECE